MKKLSLLFYFLPFISIMILFTGGCNLTITPKTSEDFATITHIPIMTAAYTTTPSQTRTKTPLPVTTLTASEREEFVRKSLTSNLNCTLPCWWGIVPGETTWKETEDLLQYLGVRIGSASGYSTNAIFHGTGGFDFDGSSIINRFSFEETNGVINAILIRSDGHGATDDFQGLWMNYSPRVILEMYGMPDRVWLNVTNAYASSRGYHLWFFYDKQGFMIRYSGSVLDGLLLRVCPVIEEMTSINISLQDPNNPLSLGRFDAILEDIRLETETGKTRGLYSIQDATGLDMEDLYNIFMQEKEKPCFDTPSSIWDKVNP